MKNWKTIALAVNLLFVLAIFGMTVIKNEQVRSNGKELYLALRPIDPRSVMQGDYMELQYTLCNDIRDCSTKSENRYAVVDIISGSLVRLQNSPEPVSTEEVALKYYIKEGTFFEKIRLSNHTYLFQEGTGKYYENAKYALVKVDDSGNMQVLHLCDQHLQIISPKPSDN